LGDGLDACEQRQDRERDKGDREDIEAEHGSALSERFPATPARILIREWTSGLPQKTHQPNKPVPPEMWRR
jgi:hypothetical protein